MSGEELYRIIEEHDPELPTEADVALMYNDFKKTQALQKNDEHADDIADENAAPGTPIAPHSPRGRNLHPEANANNLLFYGPDTTYGVTEIKRHKEEDNAIEEMVQDPKVRVKLINRIHEHVVDFMAQMETKNDPAFPIYIQGILAKLLGVTLQRVDDTAPALLTPR
jgi:hypothetical protein